MKFKLWLEFEQWSKENQWDKENEFANIGVDLPDGRHYGINVWTYKFLETAVRQDTATNNNLQGNYQIPPDLFVREMTRDCVESTIDDLLRQGNLEEVLNNSIFGIRFLEPWIDALELPENGNHLKEELAKELSEEHILFGKTCEVIAKRQDNDDVLFRMADRTLAVVHLTWHSKKACKTYPRTQIYRNEKEFWQLRLKADIEEFGV